MTLFTMSRLAAVCAALFWSALPVRAQSEPVTIFAAASLKTVLDQIATEQGLNINIAYGGSAAMARQVAQGAEADIVILANNNWMDWLEQQAVLGKQGSCILTGNSLVMIAPKGSDMPAPRSVLDIVTGLDGGRFAIGNMRSVPAGQYAQEFLISRGWLDALRPHLAETANVRLALALVARGEAPLGLVYASDAIAEPRVQVVYAVPQELHSPVRYPAALTQNAVTGAAAVLATLAGATPTFLQSGFMPLASGTQGRCTP